MKEIIPNIYRIKMPHGITPGFEASNVYFIGKSEIIIIDAGYTNEKSEKALMDAWHELGSPHVKAILLTHAHIDHAGALEVLKNETKAPVYIHKNEIERLSAMFSMEQYDIILEGGEEIEIDGFRLKTLYMPGHTAGHLCFFEKANKALFTGDMILGNNFALIVPPDGDLDTYMNSLEQAKSLSPKIILPGHGKPVFKAGEKIEEYIAHRENRNKQILQCLESGPMSIPDMAESIYAEMSPGLRIIGRLQILAHLSKLVKDGLTEFVSGEGIEGIYKSLIKRTD